MISHFGGVTGKNCASQATKTSFIIILARRVGIRYGFALATIYSHPRNREEKKRLEIGITQKYIRSVIIIIIINMLMPAYQ